MWKLIVLSAVLILAKASNIQDIYGKWVPVVDYQPNPNPICLDISFERSPEDVPCTCSDGRNITLLKITSKPVGKEEIRSVNIRVLAVDASADVMPALSVSCNCGAEDPTARAVARLVDNNYFILYEKPTSSAAVQADAQLYSKTVVSRAMLLSDIEGIEELRQRNGTVLCSN